MTETTLEASPEATFAAGPVSDGAETSLERRGTLLLAIAFGLVIATGLFICFMAVPVLDDYRRAIRVRDLGLIDAVLLRRREWTGRWTAVGLVMLATKISDLYTIYPLYLLAFYSAFYSALHLLTAIILGLPVRGRSTFFYSAFLMCVYWVGMPSTGESFYWMTGTTSEHLFFILSVGALASVRLYQKGRKAPALILGCVAVFVASGVHDLYDLMLGYILVLLVFISWIEGFRLHIFWITLGVVLGAGFLIVASAPGNEVRAQSYVEMYMNRQESFPTMGERVFMAIERLSTDWLTWSISAPFLTLTAFLACRPANLDFNPSWLVSLSGKSRVLIVGGGILGLALGYLGYAVITAREYYFLRMLNFFYLWFLIWWVATFVILTNGKRLKIVPSYFMAICIFAVLSLMSHNMKSTVLQLADGTIFRFSGFMHYIDHELQKDEYAGRPFYIRGIPVRPAVLMEYHIGADLSHNANNWIAQYYGIEGFYVGTPPPQPMQAPAAE